ncbi:MAG: HAD-IB family phosphatase [Chakrabartia sp.]
MSATFVDSLLIGKVQWHYGKMMQGISIYDMDKTITGKATFGPFLAYAVPRYRPWRLILLPVLVIMILGYALKIVNRAQLKEINLRLLLGAVIDSAALKKLSSEFAVQTLKTNLLQGALARIEADRAEGRNIILATASYDFYVVEIARLLGIDDVIATKATRRGSFTVPTIDGENCYGAAKLAMVEAWVVRNKIKRSETHIRFYSDHVSDAPCLIWADEAFATTPHAPLRTLARERGWTVFDWA